MKLGILTSVDTRHRYFARRLCAELEVVAIGYEQTGYSPASVEQFDLTENELRIVEAHFAERARQELRFFGADSEFVTPDDACAVAQLSAGALNTDATLAFLTSARVDTVAVFGTNLIKPPLLSRWPGRMVNMHLGLSPYYRGTATNFYPLLNEEPEFVGATIHLLDSGIDAGSILKHARPQIVADDRPHTIGCKAIDAGIAAMIAVLCQLDGGSITPVPQWEVLSPRLYLRKDYHPRQVVELYEKLDGGMIPRYVEQAADRSRSVRLVE